MIKHTLVSVWSFGSDQRCAILSQNLLDEYLRTPDIIVRSRHCPSVLSKRTSTSFSEFAINSSTDLHGPERLLECQVRSTDLVESLNNTCDRYVTVSYFTQNVVRIIIQSRWDVSRFRGSCWNVFVSQDFW